MSPTAAANLATQPETTSTTAGGSAQEKGGPATLQQQEPPVASGTGERDAPGENEAAGENENSEEEHVFVGIEKVAVCAETTWQLAEGEVGVSKSWEPVEHFEKAKKKSTKEVWDAFRNSKKYTLDTEAIRAAVKQPAVSQSSVLQSSFQNSSAQMDILQQLLQVEDWDKAVSRVTGSHVVSKDEVHYSVALPNGKGLIWVEFSELMKRAPEKLAAYLASKVDFTNDK